MRTIACAVTLLLSYLSFAQCDYEIDEKDAFTGEFTRMVEDNFPHGKVQFTNTNGAYTMQLIYSNVNYSTALEAKGGDALMIKLDNDEMITLTCLDVNPSGKEKKPTMYASPTYELTEEQMTALGTNEMVTVRITFNEQEVDEEVGKYGGKIMEGAQCIML